MDEIKNKDTKTGNQAWRRKPRKFAPKSRLGCKTCKIRRIKCDLSQPSCSKCLSTGRTCDGYGEMRLPRKTEIEYTHYHQVIADRTDSYDSYHGFVLQNLGSFMILPVTGSTQAEAMCFFKDISIKHLNAYRPCEPWRKILMLFAQTVPAVRHAAIALALTHRTYQDHHSNAPLYQPSSSIDRLPDKAPLLHYNRAIQLLLNPESSDRAEITAITLIVCYLFTCFDHLAGDDVQAVKHLRGGVELSRTINNNSNNATLNNDTYGNTLSPGDHQILYHVTEQIRRLDMQVVMFLVDWTPANMQETFLSHPAQLDNSSAFRSLDQAADYLQILLAQVMRLHNAEHQMSPMGTMPPFPSSFKDVVLGQLETWSNQFETLSLRKQGGSSPSESDFETGTNPLISLLCLQYTIAWTLLRGYGPNREMDYDNFLSQFRHCVALADKVTTAHHLFGSSSSSSSSSRRSTFTPEIGFIPVLYIIGSSAGTRLSVVRSWVFCNGKSFGRPLGIASPLLGWLSGRSRLRKRVELERSVWDRCSAWNRFLCGGGSRRCLIYASQGGGMALRRGWISRIRSVVGRAYMLSRYGRRERKRKESVATILDNSTI